MEHLTTHGTEPGTGSSAAAFEALVFIRLSCWFIKNSEELLGSSKGRGKTFQQCEENFLSVKDILCTARGSTQVCYLLLLLHRHIILLVRVPPSECNLSPGDSQHPTDDSSNSDISLAFW